MLIPITSNAQIPIKSATQWKLDKFFKAPVTLARPVPRLPIDIIAGFKTDYAADALRSCWKRLRDGERYDPEGTMVKSGVIHDRTQQVALVTTESGVTCLNLRGILRLPSARMEHKTEREMQAEIRRGKLSGNVVRFANVAFNANLLELLVKNLKVDWITGEEGYYSLGMPAPRQNGGNGNLLIVRNNVTLMVGVLASMRT